MEMARGGLGWRYFLGTGAWMLVLDVGLPYLGLPRGSPGYLLVLLVFLLSFGSIAMRLGTSTQDVATNVGGSLYLAAAIVAILTLVGFLAAGTDVVRSLILAAVLVAVVLDLVLPRLAPGGPGFGPS